MGEFINNIQEKIEAVIGEILEERQKSLCHFKGLGPPDLCVLTKSYEPPRFVPGLKPTKISSYHWVLGVDTSSTSSIAVYLSSLIDSQEKSSFGRGVYKIESCHFCCYNAFLKMDLHVEMPISAMNSVPVVYAIGRNNEKTVVEDVFWKETYLSSVLRHIQGGPPYLRPVKILPCLKDPKDELEFLKQCSSHFWSGRKLGSFDSEFIDQKSPNTEGLEVDDANNLLVSTLSNYFTIRNRYLPMLSFFEAFQSTEPCVSVPVAISLRLMTCGNDAVDVLESALDKQPNNTTILLELSKTLIHLAKRENPQTNSDKIQKLLLKALEHALKALSLRPKIIRAWGIASNILFLLGSVEWALLFLNNAPMAKEDHVTDRIGKTKYARVTPPPERPNILNVLEDDELEFDEEPGDEMLKCLTSVTLSGDSFNYYNYLITMYKKIGWKALVEKKANTLDEITRNKFKKIPTSLGNSGSVPQQKPSTPLTSSVNQVVSPSTSATNTSNENQQSFKDSHNATSPTNKIKATENTLTDSTDTSEIRHQIHEDPNISKEVLWRDEDVTSEGSDIENDQEDQETKDGNTSSTSPQTHTETTTEPTKQIENQLKEVDLASPNGGDPQPEQPTVTQQPPPQRPEWKETDLKIDNLSDILSSFIDNYGSDSLRDKLTKEYITLEFGQDVTLRAKLPITTSNKNLELAFHALFQDVKAHRMWIDEIEQKKLRLDTFNQLTMKQMNPTRTISDWLRLARLSYRLGELMESERLYKWIFDETRFNPRALLGLVQIFTEHNDIRNVLMSSSSIIKYYFSDKVKCMELHPTVERSILNVISINGLQKVRNIHSSLNDSHPSINGLFLDSVKWRSNGFDR
ncbi:hypothetical protein DLAC_10107 [Tieghemostelium lacteum]|uniref:Uncharacterized protein n=1 Tax=Tieghemostelium lacteum TaxID=361077 RepID=A0A151Z653_TIELA|nr:hypothetical protein DLAC_10107 [Tieghemostelium lacteum]|eukprot:KYQ89441.1 hypothetical protein DLAC_10107 [Tieghemostelium lacteum]